MFKDKDSVEIPYTCKLCLQEVKFTVSKEEYKATIKFPIKKEVTHGDPKHILIAYLNQYLEVETFEIKELEQKKEVSFSKDLTRQVLSELDLKDDEIELYFRTTGREAVSVGEMAILINKSKEECEAIAKKFIQKGLFKEIIGAKPHYAALPPYAALVAQLKKFHQHISDIKESIPIQLDQSFKKLESKGEIVEKAPDSSEMMKELKSNMLNQIKSQKKEFDETMAVMDQIRGITDEISSLEGLSDDMMGDQLGDLTNQFQDINQRTTSIIKNQINELRDEFGTIKSTISNNLQKLRLGVVQQTVDQVIEKVVDTRLKEIMDNINVQLSVKEVAFSDELKKVSKGLNNDLVSKLKSSIQSTLKNLDGLTAKTEEDKEKIFSSISENFNKAVEMAESKIQGISGGVFESFGDLKDVFSNQIVATLDSTLSDILKRLEVSEKVTNEFWEQSKSGMGLTMKDIWFIRSIESAQAHISDEISKAKMRVLIVAPTITDIDINAIQERPSRINFRIAASINMGDPKHVEVINKLDQMDNVDYRHRALQNLFGINRDYESVIICMLSKTEIKGGTATEIAGIGSIIEEHIKIFVPVLEESWMSARKEVLHSVKASIAKGSETPVIPEVEPPKPQEETPIELQPPEPSISEPPQPEIGGTVSKVLLGKQFDLIFDSIDSLTGIELAAALEKFQSEYVKKQGYISVLKNIRSAGDELKAKSYVLSQSEQQDLKIKMKFWKQKLNF